MEVLQTSLYLLIIDSMGRLLFPKGEQSAFIASLLKNRKNAVGELAVFCGVSERTIRDWRREKFTLPEDAFRKMQKHLHIPTPAVTRLADYWYAKKGARLGALRRLELYGPPGTKEGRQKGGRISQLRRKQFPERYPNCPIPKDYDFPKLSTNLAEFIGIILGDGGLTPYQLKVTLNSEEEKEYRLFVSNLVFQLFHVHPKIYQRKDEKTCNVSVAGMQLIKVLNKLGVACGSKVKRQVQVPRWVKNNSNYARACLRGLMDTDGCVYHHHHVSHGVHCLNLGLTFTNLSRPLVEFVFQTLLSLGLTAKKTAHGVFVYRKQEVDRYFSVIGSHNGHHIQRYSSFATIKAARRDTQEA